MIDVAIVPYAATHWGFILTEVRNAAGRWPNVQRREGIALRHRFADLARQTTEDNPAGCWVAVVPDDNDLFIGFLLSPGPQQVTFCYVKYSLRRMWVGARLAAAAGIDMARPVAVSIWTPNASRMAAAGKPLYPAIPKEAEED